MAHTFLAKFKIIPDKKDEFLETVEKMEKAVAENEPEALIYKFYKLREPNTYAALESFTTEAADEAHQNSQHFKAIAPAMIACIDGGWEREYLDDI